MFIGEGLLSMQGYDSGSAQLPPIGVVRAAVSAMLALGERHSIGVEMPIQRG